MALAGQVADASAGVTLFRQVWAVRPDVFLGAARVALRGIGAGVLEVSTRPAVVARAVGVGSRTRAALSLRVSDFTAAFTRGTPVGTSRADMLFGPTGVALWRTGAVKLEVAAGAAVVTGLVCHSPLATPCSAPRGRPLPDKFLGIMVFAGRNDGGLLFAVLMGVLMGVLDLVAFDGKVTDAAAALARGGEVGTGNLDMVLRQRENQNS